MRGNAALHRRAGAKPRPSNEATARTYSLPAPVGGWNARGNLSAMAPTDAVQLDNIFPAVQNVQIRKGSIDWATGAAADIKTLITYTSGTTSKLFASTNAGIYDVTITGAFGAAVTTCTYGIWNYVNFTTAGGSFLTLANGVDAVKQYDGTTWSASAITGVTPSSLFYVTAHQRRLWFIQNSSMNLWYLPVDSISGAATQFPCGSLFRKGGRLVAVGSWTLDAGNGVNDMFVIATSNGELAIYQGSDPASSTTWSLVGVFDVPAPLGVRPFADFGGDLLYMSKGGIIAVSTLLSSAVDESRRMTYKVESAYLDAAQAYPNNYGWQMIMHKAQNALIVNIPVSQDSTAYQFVMNTTSRAWCRFLGWNAMTWSQLGDDLYFACGRKVYKSWQGVTDSGAAIQGTAIQAYSALGMGGQKSVSLVRPNVGLSGAASIITALDNDFKTFGGQSQINYQPVSASGIWDVSQFDTALWDGGSTMADPRWTTVPNNPGYLHSFRLQIITSASTFSWISTDFALKPAGIL